jgi:hypothetical protein
MLTRKMIRELRSLGIRSNFCRFYRAPGRLGEIFDPDSSVRRDHSAGLGHFDRTS